MEELILEKRTAKIKNKKTLREQCFLVLNYVKVHGAYGGVVDFALEQFAISNKNGLLGFLLRCTLEFYPIETEANYIKKWIDIKKVVFDIDHADHDENKNEDNRHGDILNFESEREKNKERKITQKVLFGYVFA